MNYDKEMEKIISSLDHTPKLLLHSCCAPCSSATIERLKDYFDITVLYYNPNIEPLEEYEHRKSEQKRLLSILKSPNKLEFLDEDYDPKEFQKLSEGHESDPERGPRCYLCYKERLKHTYEKAKELGYEYFGTTLSISPYKVSSWINEIGLSLEDENTKFLVADFKKKNGYKRSIELSKEYGLYRQDYCGCKFSKRIYDKKVILDKVEFSKMREEDLESVRELYDAERPLETNRDKMISTFDKLKSNPSYYLIVGRLEGEVVAFAEVCRHLDMFENNDDFYTIWSVRVKKDYRKMGIATKLFKYIEDLVRTDGGAFIALLADKDNEEANALYEKLGYSTVNGYVKFDLKRM